MSADDKEPYFDGPHMSSPGQLPPSNMQENEMQHHYNVPVMMYNQQQQPSFNEFQENQFPPLSVHQQPDFYNHNHLENYHPNSFEQQEHKMNALQMQQQDYETVSSSENSMSTDQQSSSCNNSLTTSSHQSSPQRTVESYPSNLKQPEELVPQNRTLPNINSFQDLASSSNMLPSTSSNFLNSSAQYMAPAGNNSTNDQDIAYDPTLAPPVMHESVGQNYSFGSYMNMADSNSAQLPYHLNYGQHPDDGGHIDASSSHLHPTNERREYDGLHSQGTWPSLSTPSASTSEWNLVENNHQQPIGDPVLGDVNNLENEMLNSEKDGVLLKHSESFEVLNVVIPEMEKLNIFPDVDLDPTDDNLVAENNVAESNIEYSAQIGPNEPNLQQQSFEESQYQSGSFIPEFSKENAKMAPGPNSEPDDYSNQFVPQEIETVEKTTEPIKNNDEESSHSRTNSVGSLQERRNSNSSFGSRRSGVSQRSGPPVVVDAGNLPENVQHPENEGANMIDTHTMHSSYVSVEPRPVDNSDSLKAPSYHQPSYSGPSNNNLHSQMAVTSAPPARMVPITPSTSNGYNQSYSDMHSSLHPYVEDRSSADPKDNSASFSASTSDLKLSSEQEANQPAAPVVAATNMDGNYQPDNVGQSQPDTSNSQDLVRSSSGYKPPMTSEPISTNYLGNSNQHVELHQANVVSTNQPPIQQVPNPTSQPPVSSDPGYSQPAYPPQPPPQHPTVLAAGLEQTPQSNVGQSNYPQPNTYASNQPVFQQNIADATAPSVRPHFNPKENLPTSSYRSNQESGYLSQTNSQQPLPPNQQVPDRNYHQALNVRDHTEPPIHHRHSVPTISSHQTSSYNDGHYHNQPSATGQPDGYPHVSSNLHAPSQNRGAGNHREPSSHRPASGYGAPYYQNTSNQPENAERVPSRPPSRSSITGESTYVPYQEKSNYDQYNSYNRPRSRQGHDYDQRYSGRYNNEYDDYYRARNQDYYNRSYSRDYYQGQGDYYRKYSGYYDQRYYYDRRTSEPQGSRYYQDQYYNQQRSYNDWRSQGQAYDPRYYDNQDRSKVDSYNASNVQDQSSYATNNFNESVQQGYQYKGEHTLEDTTSYPNTFDEETWPNLPQVPARRTPVKFNSAHPILRFGAGGVLIHVLPNSPVDGKPATVEISSVETLLEDTSEAEEFRSYPGPLSRKETHKIDVVSFTTQQSNQSQRRTDLVDRNSVSLTWDFLSVLVRQNGTIMGTDVAELLMRDHSGNFDLMQSPNDMQRRPPPNTDEPVNQNDEANVNSEDNTTLRFRDLLLYGRKKDALEWAMKSNLWGHALLLASKTDARTHANVMLRFANSLPINDPLQTLYQLMSGRQPAATTCITEEEWGDWRPHLAMMLSNTTDSISLDTKVVMTLGDTLLAKGLLDAAHFCYLMATSPLGYYSKKSAKLVLIGSNHTLPFYEFATNEGIRKSECYEYALALGHATNRTKMEFMPALQIYKLIYAGRLMELGLVEKAFHYCENIAKFVCKSPNLYSVTLVSQLTELINVMQYHDPRVQAGGQLSSDLRWIQSLLAVNERMGKSSLGSLPPPSTISPSLISSVTSHLDSSSSGEEEDEEVRELPSPQEMVQNIYQQRDQNQPIQNVQLDGYQVNAPAQPVEPTFYQPHQVESLMQQSNPLPQQQQQQQLQQHHQQQQQQQDFEQQPQFNQQQFPPQQQQNNQPPPLFQPQQQQNYQQPQFYPNQPAEFQNSQIAQQPPVKNQPTNDHYNQYPSMPSHEAVSRVRTTSQTSHQSHTSHASQRSRKSTGRRSRTTSETSHRSRSRSTSAESIKKEKAAEKEKKGWGIMNWFTKKKVNQVHLPDDNVKELVWDPVRKRWTNGEEEEEEELAPPPPMEATPASAPDAPMPSGGLTRNKFSLKNLNNRSMYKDAFGGGATTSSSQNIAPPSLFPVAPSQQSNPSVFIPKPVPTSGPSEAVNQENHNLAESQNLKHLEKQQQQEQNNFQPQQQPPMFQPQQSNQQQQQQQYDQQDNIQPQQNHQQQQQNHQQPQFNQQQQFNPQQQFQPQVNDQNLQQQQLQPQSNFQQQQPFMPQQQYQPDIQQKQQPQQIQQHPNPNQVNTPPPSTDPPQVAPSNPVPQSDPVAAPPMTTFYNPTQFGAGQNSNPFSQPTAPTRGGFSSRRGRGRSYPKISGK